jgi:hypothetical protein
MENWALNIVFGRTDDCAIAGETLATVLDDLGALGWHEKAIVQTGETVLCAFFPSSVPHEPAIERLRQIVEIQRTEGVLQSLPRMFAAAVEEHDWVVEWRRPPGWHLQGRCGAICASFQAMWSRQTAERFRSDRLQCPVRKDAAAA